MQRIVSLELIQVELKANFRFPSQELKVIKVSKFWSNEMRVKIDAAATNERLLRSAQNWSAPTEGEINQLLTLQLATKQKPHQLDCFLFRSTKSNTWTSSRGPSGRYKWGPKLVHAIHEVCRCRCRRRRLIRADQLSCDDTFAAPSRAGAKSIAPIANLRFLKLKFKKRIVMTRFGLAPLQMMRRAGQDNDFW